MPGRPGRPAPGTGLDGRPHRGPRGPASLVVPHADGVAEGRRDVPGGDDLPGRAGKPADLATLTVEDEVASVVANIEASAFDEPVTVNLAGQVYHFDPPKGVGPSR